MQKSPLKNGSALQKYCGNHCLLSARAVWNNPYGITEKKANKHRIGAFDYALGRKLVSC